MLENQVEKLKEMAREGERIEKESQNFLDMVVRKEEAQENIDDVSKYLSREHAREARKVFFF